jgi:hypothetical protein
MSGHIPTRIWRQHIEGRSHVDACRNLRQAVADARAEGALRDATDLEAALRDLDGVVPVPVTTTWDGEDGA